MRRSRLLAAAERLRDPPRTSSGIGSSGIVLTLLTVLLVWLGIYPLPLLETTRTIFVGSI